MDIVAFVKERSQAAELVEQRQRLGFEFLTQIVPMRWTVSSLE